MAGDVSTSENLAFDFSLDAVTAARELIGWTLLYNDVGGIIVETEAYLPDDEASHSFKGKTKRNAAMFEPAGTLYVYQIYGMHHCLNFVSGNQDGQAVLLRALEPTQGIDQMRERRGTKDVKNLCSGPAKLVQALGLSKLHNGVTFEASGLQLTPPTAPPPIGQSSRIGITKATEHEWRFFALNSSFTSRSTHNK